MADLDSVLATAIEALQACDGVIWRQSKLLHDYDDDTVEFVVAHQLKDVNDELMRHVSILIGSRRKIVEGEV